MNDDVVACAKIVEKGDSARFRSVMAVPPRYRPALFALYAFNLETSRAPWVSQETIISEMRLQWWYDALQEIANATPHRRHEVITPLAQVLTSSNAQVLQRLVAARRWDIYKDPFADQEEFEAYIEATSTSLLYVAASMLGKVDSSVLNHFGYASGLGRFFLPIPQLLNNQRQPLLDLSPDALRMQAQIGLERLSSARSKRKDVSRKAGYAFLAGWQTGIILKNAIRNPEKILSGELLNHQRAYSSSLIMRSLTGMW